MKNTYKIAILLISAFFMGCSEDTVDLVGVGTVTGRVVEAKNFNPIENAKVTLSPSNNAVFTDSDGYFTIEEVEEGDYSVSAEKEGFLTAFEPASVTKDLSVNVIFEMDLETALNRPPFKPVLVTPADGSENHELSVELIWSATDPEEDVLEYRVEIKNDYNNEVLKFENLTDTTLVVSNLKYGKKYFWQVAATDNINPEVLSGVSTFKVKANPENRYFYVKKLANGNHVIYSANYNEADSAPENEVELTSADNNSWRPRKNQSSNLTAFLRTFNNETHLFTINQDGSNVKKVTAAVPIAGYNLNDIDFAWSSNGSRLLYPSYDKLFVINKDGSGLQQIYQTPDGSFISEIDWSNDGTLVALKTNNITGYGISIYTINMAGAVIHNVLSGVNGAAGGLNISVDNKLLVYTYDVSQYQNSNNRQLDTHIFTYNFSTAEIIDISANKSAGTNDLDPRFSPNEAEIIFVNTSNDGISQKNIYKIDILDSNDRTQLFSNAVMPDWE